MAEAEAETGDVDIERTAWKERIHRWVTISNHNTCDPTRTLNAFSAVDRNIYAISM